MSYFNGFISFDVYLPTAFKFCKFSFYVVLTFSEWHSGTFFLFRRFFFNKVYDQINPKSFFAPVKRSMSTIMPTRLFTALRSRTL